MDKLPDDLLVEVLARVPDPDPGDLFRCAAVCRRWRRLIGDPGLLRRCWPEDARHRCSLLGIFVRSHEGVALAPAPRSAVGPGCRPLRGFPAGLSAGAKPVASRHGLLLVHTRSMPPLPGHAYYSCRGVGVSVDRAFRFHFVVCNDNPLLPAPATPTCHVLPALECNFYNHIYGVAILSGADCGSPSPSPAFFKVLVLSIEPDDDGYYSLRMFSSGDTSWTGPTECFNYLAGDNAERPMNRNAVVRGGMAYWQFRTGEKHRYSFLAVDTETGHATVTDVLVPMNLHYDLHLLSIAADGSRSFILHNEEHSRLEIWMQQQVPGEPAWLRTRVMEMRLPEPREGFVVILPPAVFFRSFGDKSGVLLLHDNHGCARLVDLGTGSMEELTGHFTSFSCLSAVPYEIDWPTFFLDRLGTRPVA